MIRYAMTCDKNHSFESWFASAAAFDKLQGAGMVQCSICGSVSVTKSLMTPALQAQARPPEAPLSTPGTRAEQALAEMQDRGGIGICRPVLCGRGAGDPRGRRA